MAASAFVFVAGASLLNFTRAGDALLQIVFGKRLQDGKINFSMLMTSVFALVMFVALFYSLELALTDARGSLALGAVTGIYASVMGTQKFQEKASKK
jgi:hypothetical protein